MAQIYVEIVPYTDEFEIYRSLSYSGRAFFALIDKVSQT
jgi:hypothetical protein